MAMPDWESIETDYRAGLLSVREIATKHNISHVSIVKRAKKEEWDRDLQARIKAKADALVTKREVTKQVTSEKVVTEKALVKASAEIIANIRMEHRSDIRKARQLTNLLFDELSKLCESKDELEKLGEIMLEPDKNGRDKLSELYHYIISFPERVKAVKALSESLKNIVGLEREAYNIAEVQKVELSGDVGIVDRIRNARDKANDR